MPVDNSDFLDPDNLSNGYRCVDDDDDDDDDDIHPLKGKGAQ